MISYKVTKNFSFLMAGESVPVNPFEARFLQIDIKQVFNIMQNLGN